MFKELDIDIYSHLNMLGIKQKGIPNHKGWLSILCPFHNDKHFGSCSININNGTISCFVCGSHHINDLLNNNQKIEFSYKEVPTEPIKNISPKINENKKFNFVHMKLNPDDYYYTKQRGFTKEFCETFNIVRCFSFPYKDYFCVPIIDSKKQIYTCEFRKLLQYEFETNPTKTEEMLFYIKDKKVKYETNSKLKETLWNIDNLDRDKTLYICEGIGSIPKLYLNVSRNCTCTFGVQITYAQLEYLKQFKDIIYIPDTDLAGYECVNKLRIEVKNLQIIDTEGIEDTDAKYIFIIKNTNNIMSPKQYIDKYLVHYNIKQIF